MLINKILFEIKLYYIYKKKTTKIITYSAKFMYTGTEWQFSASWYWDWWKATDTWQVTT